MSRNRSGSFAATLVRCFALLPVLFAAHEANAQSSVPTQLYRGGADDVVAAIEVRDGAVRIYRSVRAAPTTDNRAVAPTQVMAAGAGTGPTLASGQSLVTSERGTQTGRITYSTSDSGGLLAAFELLDNDTVVSRIQSTGLTRFVISEDGSTVLAVQQDIHSADSSRIVVHARGGEILGRLDQRRIRQSAIAADGSRIALNTGSDGILVLDRNGSVLHRIPESFDLRLSADGHSVAAFSVRAVIVYRDGTEVARLSTSQPARAVALTPDGALIAIAEKSVLSLYEVRGSNRLFERRAPGARHEYRSVDVAADGRVLAGILELQQRRSRKSPGRMHGELLLLDRTGSVLRSEPLDIDAANRATPEVRFIDNARRALIVSRNSVHVMDTQRAAR